MSIETELERLLALAEKATPGPWKVTQHNTEESSIYAGKEWITGLSVGGALEELPEDDNEGASAILARMDANAELIAAVPDMIAIIRAQAAEIERLRESVIEECARACEAQDATVNVYNNPLNGMKHPVAEQSYRRCAASIRALKEREAKG